MKTISLMISLMAFISCTWCAVSLYPFDSEEGVQDSMLGDGANPRAIVELSESYVVFGKKYSNTNLFISDNGYVTLKYPLLSTNPTSFPITSGSYVSRKSTMVAPYWSDIDTRCRGGEIFYRQVNLEPTSDLFQRIQHDVSLSGFGPSFHPTSAVIVTWKGVTSKCGDKRRNTFQLVLTSDGSRTFAMFLYNSLEWHTSIAGRGPATAGVNAAWGRTKYGINVTNDLSNIKNFGLVSMSNVGVPGLFVYRLDLEPSS